MRNVAVVGLGRFGMALVQQLVSSRVQVIAVDSNPDLVDEVKELVDIAVVLDCTDERALRGQEIHKVDVLVVAIGENFEAALLTTVLARKLQIPRVICRASTSIHAEIFRQVGAHEVIQPETESGIQLARTLANPFLEDFIDLGDGITLIEIHTPAAFRNKSLRELNLRARFGVNLVAIRRTRHKPGETGDSREVIGVPQPDEVIQSLDILIVIGANNDLAKLPRE